MFMILTEDVALLTKFSWERRQTWLNPYGSLNIFQIKADKYCIILICVIFL